VCGSTTLERNQIAYRSERRIPPTLVSYRCQQGHVFYVEAKGKAASNDEEILNKAARAVNNRYLQLADIALGNAKPKKKSKRAAASGE
jgi:hypothetical protein